MLLCKGLCGVSQLSAKRAGQGAPLRHHRLWSDRSGATEPDAGPSNDGAIWAGEPREGLRHTDRRLGVSADRLLEETTPRVILNRPSKGKLTTAGGLLVVNTGVGQHG